MKKVELLAGLLALALGASAQNHRPVSPNAIRPNAIGPNARAATANAEGLPPFAPLRPLSLQMQPRNPRPATTHRARQPERYARTPWSALLRRNDLGVATLERRITDVDE